MPLISTDISKWHNRIQKQTNIRGRLRLEIQRKMENLTSSNDKYT